MSDAPADSFELHDLRVEVVAPPGGRITGRSMPSAAICSRYSALCEISTISRFKRLTMAAGVPAGARIPVQTAAS